MHVIAKNLAVILTALAAMTISWIFGGTRSEYLRPVLPWLLLFVGEAILFFPQKHEGETSSDARERVWKGLRKDPVTWISLVLLLILAIPFVNKGLCPICDVASIRLGIDPEPDMPFLPFCVNKLHHWNVYSWFAFSFVCMLAVKHALTNEGKQLVLRFLCWNGFVLALFGFLELACSAPGPLWFPCDIAGAKTGEYFATFGYPNMAGDYFTTLFGLSVALWRLDWEEVRIYKKNLHDKADPNQKKMLRKKFIMLIPALVCYFAAIQTLSRAAIILATATGLIYFFHTLMANLARMHRAQRVKVGCWSLVILSVISFFALISMPSDLQREVDTLNPDAVLTRVTGKGQYHVRVATELWKDHWLFGCGGWGYKHLCIPKMTAAEYKQIQMVGGINVHNDYLQFLAEHGVVVFAGLVAIVVLLLVPVGREWRRLAKSVAFSKARESIAKPRQIFVLPAPAFCILLTALATLIHSFGDCPLRSPAVMSLFFMSLAAIPGFLPVEEEDSKK